MPAETEAKRFACELPTVRTVVQLPGPAREAIADRTRAALGRVGDFEPYRIDGPLTLDLSFKNYMPAELLAYLPNVERVDSHTVRFVARDAVELSKFIEFALSYSAGITP